MTLQEHDIVFLLKKTRLSLKSLLNLIEEQRDFDLVINSISSNLTEEDIQYFPNLSNKLKVKIALYHCSQDKNYDISEKSLVANIVYDNYDYFYKAARKMRNGQKREIKQFLVIAKSQKVDYSKFDKIASKFIQNGQKDFGNHIHDWINILNHSKSLLVSCK